MNSAILQKIKCDGIDCFENSYFSYSLKNNIAHASYNNIAIEQNPYFIFLFDELFKNIIPSRILEIGTYQGGTTVAFRDISLQYNPNVDIRSYDINTHLIHNNIDHISYFKNNIFNADYSDLNDSFSHEIISYIQQSGITYVVCDGGCKVCEFNILSRYLKDNDIIMAHDYAESYEVFISLIYQKFWNWLEIQDADTIDSCDKYGLVKLTNFCAERVGWSCFQKQSY